MTKSELLTRTTINTHFFLVTSSCNGCCQCGIEMVVVARVTFEDGDNVVSLARDVEKQAAIVSDDHIHAYSLMTLGEGSG